MKVSQKGLYALQAMMMLARRYNQGAIKIRDIAYEEELPEKFLELILLEMKNARMVESVRGAKGGYALRRPPDEIYLSEIIRLIDGPLAPFGDAEQLRALIEKDPAHRALYKVFLDVRDAGWCGEGHQGFTKEERERGWQRSADGRPRHGEQRLAHAETLSRRRAGGFSFYSCLRSVGHGAGGSVPEHHASAGDGRKGERRVREGDGAERQDRVEVV